MAGGDFNKWKDYLTKIFGNDPTINQGLFDQIKDQLQRSLQKDQDDHMKKISKYLDHEDIKKTAEDQLKKEQSQNQMKDEEEAST